MRLLAAGSLVLCAACGGGGGGSSSGGGPPANNEIDIVRDRYGVPHVFADTDTRAYYGLGYACAEDRFLQMSYARLAMQGRMAEYFGRDDGDGSEEYLRHDMLVRLMGYTRLAQALYADLDAETQALLQSYADGVNAYVSDPNAVLHPLFATSGIPVESWSASDCVLLWLRIARFFSVAEPFGEANNRHQYEALVPTLGHDGAIDRLFPDRVLDEEAAAVQQADVPAATQAAMASYAAQFGFSPLQSGSQAVDSRFHFSHAWAVSGSRTTDGSAYLVGDPRLPVRNPNSLWEAHVVGSTFEVRGAAISGTPNFISGSNGNVAWSVTSLGLDQADLYEIVPDPADPANAYMLDGNSRPYEVDEIEVIQIAGEAPLNVRYRETVWGPVAGEFPGDARFVDDAQVGELFSVRWVPREELGSGRDPAAGFVDVYRTSDAPAFGQALDGVTFPGFHCIFADANGSIGYWTVGALPLRPDASPLGGKASVDGSTSAEDWLDLVPHDLKPGVIDPARGFVYSANHLPVGAWYPIPFVNKGGHTIRSRRLLERLDALLPNAATQVDPADLRDIHFDGGWPLARDAVFLGIHLRDIQPLVDGQPFTMQPDALATLAMLESWADAGADGLVRSDVLNDGLLTSQQPAASALARWVGAIPFRSSAIGGLVDASITATYGGGDSGFTSFLRDKVRQVTAVPSVDLNLAEATWIDTVLAEGWRLALTRMGPMTQWDSWFHNVHLTGTIAGWVEFEAFPSLDPSTTRMVGPVSVAFGETILSQFQQSYTQFVRPGDEDANESLLPNGQFENPAFAHRQSTYDDQADEWLAQPQVLKPSPLARDSIENLAGPTFVTTLDVTDRP